MNYRSLDLYLIVFMSFLALYGGYRLFLDDFSADSTRDKSYVAFIARQINTVKKKNSGLIAWLDAQQGDRLSINDQVYTYQESTADLSFSDGTEIGLAENTLFKITREQLRTRLNLEQGIMHAKLTSSSSNLELYIKGARYEISSKDAEIQIMEMGNKSRITLLKGRAQISGKQNKENLVEGQYLERDESSGQEMVRQVEISLVLPAADDSLYFRPGQLIDFKWQLKRRLRQVQLIVARDREFKDIVWKRNAPMPAFRLGTYYWKVEGKEGRFTVSSGINLFHLKQEVSPTVITPDPEMTLEFLEGSGIDSVVLGWSAEETTKYQLELITPNGKVERHQLDRNNFLIAKASPGKYAFRVRVDDSKRPHSLWSEYSRFYVTQITVPPPPVLISPHSDEKMIFFEKQERDITFTWMPVLGAAGYQLQVRDIDNKEIVLDEKITDTKYRWATDVIGNFSWQVRAIDRHQRQTGFSAAHRLNFEYQQDNALFPQNGTKLELKKPNQKVTFEWKDERAIYIFELAQEREFKKIVHSYQVEQNKVDVTFPKIGTYFWRTKIVGRNNQVSYSKPSKIVIRPTPPPERPKILDETEIEIKVKKIEKQLSWLDFFFSPAYADNIDRFARIEWERNPDAAKYVVEIYRDKKMRKKVLQKAVKDNFFDWQRPQPGIFYWRIAVIDFWNRQSKFSNLSRLNVKLSAELRPITSPKLRDPDERQTIRVDKKEVEFIWRGDKRCEYYRLLIARDAQFKQVVVSQKTSKQSLSIPMSSLGGKGNIYWKVEAFGPYGQFTSSQRRESTLVTPPVLIPLEQKRFLQASFVPTSVSYQQVGADYDVFFDGVAFNSLQLAGRTPFYKENYFIDGFFRRQSGKIFDETSFSDWYLESALGRGFYLTPTCDYSLKMGLGINRLSSYRYVSDIEIVDDGLLRFLVLGEIAIKKRFGMRWEVETFAGYGLGTMSRLSVGGEGRYHWEKKYYIVGGISWDKKSTSQESLEIDVTQLQFSIGIQRDM